MNFSSLKVQTLTNKRFILGLLGIVLFPVIGYVTYSIISFSNIIEPPSYKGPVPDGALIRLGKGGISILAVSPDGNYLAVGNQVGIYLYNAKTFEPLWVNPCGSVRFLEFSPNSRLLVSISLTDGTYQRSLSEWEVDTGNILKNFNFFTEFNLYDIAWITDQNPLLAIERHQIVGQSKEGLYLGQWSIHFIDIATTKSWQVFTTQSVIDSFAFNPSGSVIAYSITNVGINIWDIERDKEVTRISLPNYVKLNFSPSGKLLLAITPGPIYIFDPVTGNELGQLDDSRHNMNLSINQDETLVVGGFDNKVTLWSLPNLAEIKSWVIDLEVYNLEWGGNSSALFIHAGDSIQTWDSSATKLLQTLEGHLTNTSNLTWSPDSKMIATTSYKYSDNSASLFVWDLQGNLLQRIERSGSIGTITWSPDSKKIVISNNEQLIFLDTQDFHIIKIIESKGVQDIDWSPDGNRLAIALADRKVSVLDFSTGAALFSMTTLPTWMPTPEFPNNPVINVAWSPNGDYIAAGMWSGPAYIWSSSDGRQLVELNHIYTAYSYFNSVVDISWSSDGRYLAGCFNSGTQPKANQDGTTSFVPGEAVILWNAQTGEQYKILKANYEITYSMDWSPNSDLLVVSLSNNGFSNLYLWNTNDLFLSLASELPELKVNGSAYEIAWAPNGKMLAALLDDGTVVVWDF